MTTKNLKVSTSNAIICEGIRLVKSNFSQIDSATKKNSAKFEFSITAEVYTNYVISRLTVKLKNQVALPGKNAIIQTLECCFAGIFATQTPTSTGSLASFARINTLSIIWPYAREYASDTLRRAGLPFPTLPIINPQKIAEQMDNSDLMKITIFDHEFNASDSIEDEKSVS